MPFGIGTSELIVLGMIALLLFGKRLPEVARSLGKGVTEFKKGISGIEEDAEKASYAPSRERARPVPADEDVAVTAPKFQPPTSAPSEAEEQHV